MTDFKHEVRHYCRKCRSKLKVPVANHHEAFCTRGCYRSFHLKRCGVCEKPLEQRYRKLRRGELTKFIKVESGPTCGDSQCRRRWRTGDNLGQFRPPRHQGSQKYDLRKETVAAQPLFSASQSPKPARRWFIVAGPELTPPQLHCATVPDGPGCKWEGGSYEQIEAENRRALKAHFAKLAKNCLYQRNTPPTNVLGGYKFPGAPTAADLGLVKPKTQPAAPVIRLAIPDDLSIPDCLRRPGAL